MSTVVDRLRERIDATTFVDTHEHLPDESARLAGAVPALRCGDWTALLSHYVCDDLACSGLSREIDSRFYDDDGADPATKFRLIESHWAHVRHTGYGLALRRTLSRLYGETDLTAESVPRIAEQYLDRLRPGLYDEVLRRHSGIEYCHVNSIQDPVFHVTDQPALLGQDLNIGSLVTPFGNPESERLFASHFESADAWMRLLDESFSRCAPHATAVKCANAYFRRLDFAPVDRARVDRIFAEAQPTQWGGYRWASGDDIRQSEDFMLRHALRRAAEHRLPVKFHTGYHAGVGRMPLAHVAKHAADIGELARDFPEVTFVAFHIGYPYQREFIALAKQFPNVYLDMCWAWIIDPVASVEFLKSFLVAVPSHKITTFGGDFVPVELVCGHAAIARAGIAQALGELVRDGWLVEEEAMALVEPLMRGNANALYGAPRSKRP